MIFDMFTGRTDNRKKGYASNDLNKVKAEAVNQCKKKQILL